MSRPTKRQRKEHPRSLLDNESLACVASPSGPICTPVVSDATKEIVLDRLDKEICKRFDFSLSSPRSGRPKVLQKGGNLASLSRPPRIDGRSKIDPTIALLKSRLKIGTNECTRALEDAVSGAYVAPSLLVLARDVHPPTILAHIPYLAKEVKTPILLLPGRASSELGRILGAKKVAIMAFLPRPTVSQDDCTDYSSHDEDHGRIDSFVNFVLSKVPIMDKKS